MSSNMTVSSRKRSLGDTNLASVVRKRIVDDLTHIKGPTT